MNKKDIISHIHVKQGDITKEKTDAIVNAANPSLLGGGGVDGAIHRAAGPKLLEECRGLGGCNHGEARITKGYDLPAAYVIHTPGPVYRGRGTEAKVLEDSYRNSLELVREKGLKSVSFPAISTGVYGFPKDEACRIAVDTSVEFMKKNDYAVDIHFVLFDMESYELYMKYIKTVSDQVIH